jgi:hypothetical protein
MRFVVWPVEMASSFPTGQDQRAGPPAVKTTRRTADLPTKRKGVKPMKTLVSTFIVALAFTFVGPAFAGDVTKATNAADCEKAGGMWDADAKKCSEKKM